MAPVDDAITSREEVLSPVYSHYVTAKLHVHEAREKASTCLVLALFRALSSRNIPLI